MLCRLDASRKPVGTGLLAKSVVSDASYVLTPRVRQQAGYSIRVVLRAPETTPSL